MDHRCWKGPLGITESKPPEAGAPEPGCTGMHPGGFWISPGKETPSPLWVVCFRALPLSQFFMFMWNLLQFVPCAPCPGWHQTEPGPILLSLTIYHSQPTLPQVHSPGALSLSHQEVLHFPSLHHLCSPPLGSLQQFIAWGRGAQHWMQHPRSDTGEEHLPHLPASLCNAPQRPIGLLGHTTGSWPTIGQLLMNRWSTRTPKFFSAELLSSSFTCNLNGFPAAFSDHSPTSQWGLASSIANINTAYGWWEPPALLTFTAMMSTPFFILFISPMLKSSAAPEACDGRRMAWMYPANCTSTERATDVVHARHPPSVRASIITAACKVICELKWVF